MSEATFYVWKKKYAHLGVSELRRLRQLEDENDRLKRLVADLIARQAHAVGGAAKKSLRPARRRELAGWLQATFGVSCVRACRLAQFSRAAWYRRSRGATISRRCGRGFASSRTRGRGSGICASGCCLRREGWLVNRKRVRRLYRLDGLQLRMRVRRRKHIALHRGPAPVPVGPDGALEHGLRA